MPVADNGHAVLSEQAVVQRQAHGGRERAADPADEVKLNTTKRASASEKRQALFLLFEPVKSHLFLIFLRTFKNQCRFSASDVAVRE